MASKKSAKEPQGKENNAPSTSAAKNREPQGNENPNLNREKPQGKTDGQSKKPGRETKTKPSNKKLEAGKESAANLNVKWVLQGKKLYEAVGNKVTLLKRDPIESASMAMMIEDGAAPVSGEHFWTVNFGGASEDPSLPCAGITTSRWLKEQYGLFYSGILSKYGGFPKTDFGPTINSGDVIGILCSFSGKDLKVYFYHNGRCLGLAFQVPTSLFLPDGLCPCVKLDEVGIWAQIKKEPQNKIPKEKDRVRASVDQFDVEGYWRFKSFVDSTTGKVIPLKINEKKMRGSVLEIQKPYNEDLTWAIHLGMTHYVFFLAEKKEHNLWKKTRSIHAHHGRRPPIVLDHTTFPDFPIIEVINEPEKVVLKKQEMRVTKGGKTAVFERSYSIKKGNVFQDDYFE